jgi:hypothetical protein
MKRVNAQFRRPWRPTRGVLAGLTALTVCAVAAATCAAWEHYRRADLQARLSRFIEAERNGEVPPPPIPAPKYDASARQFLRERGAAWAPMLRTLESGAMIGVTPTSVEFNASDGTAQVGLSYGDPMVLSDYLGRINYGAAPASGPPRWGLAQTRVSGTTPSPGAPAVSGTPFIAAQSVATIRSVWQDSTAPGGK